MNLADIITADRTRIVEDVTSKKRALERLAEILAEATPYVTATEIFNALVSREKLGSTGLGEGVAIPHGRMKGLDECVGAMIRLPAEGVDFEAPDSKPVDLMFGLLVPQESSEAHLNILRGLAEMLTDNDRLLRLRKVADERSLYDAILENPTIAQAD